jgi:hypothetical protein
MVNVHIKHNFLTLLRDIYIHICIYIDIYIYIYPSYFYFAFSNKIYST